MPRLSRIAPEIPVANLPRSTDYYAAKLGFRVAMEMPDRQYAIVERDDVAIHLFEDSGRSHSAVSIHIFSDGLDELHSEFIQRGARFSQGIVRKPWGNRDFRVMDDSGNEIKFTELAPDND
jgi:catechol 2,3-dioxygenase-like lactoylglutathione lyase family enzyme